MGKRWLSRMKRGQKRGHAIHFHDYRRKGISCISYTLLIENTIWISNYTDSYRPILIILRWIHRQLKLIGFKVDTKNLSSAADDEATTSSLPLLKKRKTRGNTRVLVYSLSWWEMCSGCPCSSQEEEAYFRVTQHSSTSHHHRPKIYCPLLVLIWFCQASGTLEPPFNL